MSRVPRGKSGARSGIIGSGAFTGATVLAVVFAALMITLGRIGHTRDYFSAPLPLPAPTITPSPIPPTVHPTGTPTPTPFVPTSGTSMGSASAPVTIVEYSDFQCSICQHFALTTETELARAYVQTGKVRFIYKHFIVFGDESILAAEASEAAAEQNMFWPYHDLLMQAQASPKAEDLTIARLESLAEQVGLNMTAFKAGLESHKYREKVSRDDSEGRASGVTGSPTFFVNGAKGTGNVPFEAFQQLIEEILKGSAG